MPLSFYLSGFFLIIFTLFLLFIFLSPLFNAQVPTYKPYPSPSPLAMQPEIDP